MQNSTSYRCNIPCSVNSSSLVLYDGTKTLLVGGPLGLTLCFCICLHFLPFSGIVSKSETVLKIGLFCHQLILDSCFLFVSEIWPSGFFVTSSCTVVLLVGGGIEDSSNSLWSITTFIMIKVRSEINTFDPHFQDNFIADHLMC